MATLVRVTNPQAGSLIDQAIAIFYASPNSFTGEDVLELHLHGSMAVVKLVSDLLIKIPGMRPAEPGEFTMRAFLNKKLDLAQVEGLADLLDAETEEQHNHSIKQMSGELSSVYQAWRRSMIAIMSSVEAFIDFPDDVDESAIARVREEIALLRAQIEAHLSTAARGESIKNGLKVAIIGPPNSGKSSLLNRLAGKDVAIVSHIAGTTRDVVEVRLNISGYLVVVRDTAGIRETSDEIEVEGIRRSIKSAQDADLVLEMDGYMYPNALRVAGKSDMPQHKRTDDALSISSKTGEGIDELLQRVSDFAQNFFRNSSDTLFLTSSRHKQNLEICAAELAAARFDDLILLGETLRRAAFALGRITGEIDTEDILDKIFSSFCIGK